MAEKSDYELTEREAEVLKAATEAALAEAGGRGGEAGGAIGGALGGMLGGGPAGAAGGAAGGRSGGRSGGARGGRLGLRMTKPRTAELTVEVASDPGAVRERAREAIASGGAVIEDPNRAGDDSVWGLVPSGARDMMPALVRVRVAGASAGGSRVHVRATGREGLIKQRIGAKAANRIAAAVGGRA